MAETPSDQSSRESRIDDAIARYLELAERGHPPDQQEYIAQHPDLAAELQSFFADQAQFQQLAGELAPGGATIEPEPENQTLASPTPGSATPGHLSDPSPATMAWKDRSRDLHENIVRYFGDYELLEEIARGGMGVVFKARQTSLNRIVAVKMILSGQLASPGDVQRFRTEAEAAAQLDHPGIVPIYEVGQHEGQHYFAMGFVEGASLAVRVAQGPLPPREAAEIVREVAVAVQYAHDHGVIHRDLKPGNVLLDKDGHPRVTDFGLAKLIESGSDLTGTGQILGTPSYMPPEQAAAQVSAVSRLSDVYSLGAVLYCLLAGRPPFQAANPLETLLQVQKQEPVAPRQLNPNLPLDLDTIVLKCLDKSPTRRYASAKALAEELNRYLEGRPILARPVGRIERFWRWCRREPVVAGLSAAVAIALIAGTIISSYYGVLAANRANEKARLADEKGKLADVNGRLAKDMTNLADEKGALAATNARQTVIVRDKALELRRTLYIADMSRVSDWAKTGNVAAMRSVLERYLPTDPDDVDLRAFEWYYWWQCSHAELRVIDIGEPIRRLIWSPDGQTVVYGTANGRVAGRFVSTGERAPPEFQIGISPVERISWGIESNTIMAIDETGNAVMQRSKPPQTSMAFDVVQLGRFGVSSIPRTPAVFTHRGDQLFCRGGIAPRIADISEMRSAEDLTDLASRQPREVVTLPAGAHGDFILIQSEVVGPDPASIERGQFIGERRPERWIVSELWDFDDPTAPPREEWGDPIFSAAFSPAGDLLVLSDRAGQLQFWNAHEGKLLLTVPAAQGIVWDVAISADGDRLASAGADGTVKIWSIDGTLQATYAGHGTAVRAVCFGPSGSVLSAGDDGTIHIWQAATGVRSDRFYGHAGRATAVAVSPDESQAASCGLDGTIRLWNLRKPGSEQQLTGPPDVPGRWLPSISPDGRVIACLAQHGKKQLIAEWDLRSAQLIDAFHCSECNTAPVLSADGRYLAFSAREMIRKGDTFYDSWKLKLWDRRTRQEVAALSLGETESRGAFSVSRLPQLLDPTACFLADGTMLVATTIDQRLVQVAVPSGEVVGECPLPFMPKSIELLSNQCHVFCLSPTTISLRTPPGSPPQPGGPGRAAVVSLTDGTVVAAKDDVNWRTQSLSRLADELVVVKYERPGQPNRQPDFPQSALSKPKLEVWKLPELQLVREIERDVFPTAIALSPDGKRMAVAGRHIIAGSLGLDILAWPEGTLLDQIEIKEPELAALIPWEPSGAPADNARIARISSSPWMINNARFDDSGRRLVINFNNVSYYSPEPCILIVDIPSHRLAALAKPLGAITAADFQPESDQWIVAACASGIRSAERLPHPRFFQLFPGAPQTRARTRDGPMSVASQEAILGLARSTHQPTHFCGPYWTRRPVSHVARLPARGQFLTTLGVMSEAGKLVYGFIDAPSGESANPVRAKTPQQFEQERMWQRQHERLGTVLAVSVDGKRVLIDSKPGHLVLWDYDDRAGLTSKVEFPLDCRHIAGPSWAPDGERWLVGTDRRVLLMTAAGETQELLPHDSLVTALAFAADGRWAATCDSDGLVRLYETATWTSRDLRGHRGRVTALGFAPDRQTLASVGLDGELRFWDLASGEAKLVHSWDSVPLHSLAFDSTGEELVVGGDAGRLFWCRAPRSDPSPLTPAPQQSVLRPSTPQISTYAAPKSSAVPASEAAGEGNPDRKMAGLLARTAADNHVNVTLLVNGQHSGGYDAAKLQTLPLDQFAIVTIDLQLKSPVEETFWELLQKLNNLKVLRLTYRGTLTQVQVEPLGQLAGLKHLSLTGMQGLSAMKSWPGFPQLESLNLQESDCTDDSLGWLENCRTLREVRLNQTQITDGCMDHLVRLPQLSSISAASTKFGDAAMARLASMTKLNGLNLDATSVTNAGMRLLSAIRLTSLSLRDTAIDDDSIPTLIQVMSNQADLHELDLRGSRLTLQGAASLLDMLDERVVVRLEPSNSPADPQIGAALWALRNDGRLRVDGKSLPRGEALRQLLAGARLTGLEVKINDYSQWYEHDPQRSGLERPELLPHLTDLDLQIEEFTREQREKILGPLHRLPALQRLKLGAAGTSQYDNIEILEQIGPLMQLQELSLKELYVGDAGIKTLQAMPLLRSLKFCADTEMDAGKVRMSLPNCEVIDNTFELLDTDSNGEMSESEFKGSYRVRTRFEGAGITPKFPLKRDEFLKLYPQPRGK